METFTSQEPNSERESSIELQKLLTQSEVARLAFAEKQLATNLELARLEINHHQEMETKGSADKRKIFALSVFALLLFLAVIVGFTCWCLYLGKEQFVIDLLKYSLYPISAGGGYWAGRISRQQSALE
jgi:Flp pilus assembly protein TadB